MRPKTYGRKNRVIRDSRYEGFLKSSPCKRDKEATSSRALTEIAINATIFQPEQTTLETRKLEGSQLGGEKQTTKRRGISNLPAFTESNAEKCPRARDRSDGRVSRRRASNGQPSPERLATALKELHVKASSPPPPHTDSQSPRSGKEEQHHHHHRHHPCSSTLSGLQSTSSEGQCVSSTSLAANIDDATREYVSPLLSLRSVDSEVADFAAWFSERTKSLSLNKIGEGSFGEVYRASITTTTLPSSYSSTSNNNNSNNDNDEENDPTVILKLIPLNLPRGPGSRCFTSISSAANEIRMLARMQRVPGFVQFRGACVLRGRPPERLAELWTEYAGTGRSVASRDPGQRGSYPATQLWLLVEMSDAGASLEVGRYAPPSGMLTRGAAPDVRGERGAGALGATTTEGRRRRNKILSVHRAWDVFWQVADALAKAELYARFEHRDLHMGNICAKDVVVSEGADAEDAKLVSEDSPTPFGLRSTGVEVTIIDYSLSRATFPTGAGQGETIFFDLLSDKELLRGQGDLQYDMYRWVADILRSKSSCRDFTPETNVIWLYYVLIQVMAMTVDAPTIRKEDHRPGLVSKAAKAWTIFNDLRSLMDPGAMSDWQLRCAGDLIDYGIAKQWFSLEDIAQR